MFNNVFQYVDKLVDICRPQRLIYMAVGMKHTNLSFLIWFRRSSP